MLVLLLFMLIAVGNFALGFGLAVWMGHGPDFGPWRGGNEALRTLRSNLRSRR